jgi:hypothetical protein
LVDDDEDGDNAAGDTPTADQRSAIPLDAQPTAGVGTPSFSLQAARDGITAGSQYLTSSRRPSRTAVPGVAPPRAAKQTAVGPDPMLSEQIMKLVDPQGQMTPSQRKLAAYSLVYQHNLNKSPQHAARAAGSLLATDEFETARFVERGKHALKSGNAQDAAKFLELAYNQIPNGQDMKIVANGNGFAYEVTDEATGKRLRQGVLSPSEFLGQINRLDSNLLHKELMHAAGVREPQVKPQQPVRGEKPSDVEKRTGLIDSAAPDNPSDKSLGDVRSVADSILQSNKVRADDAVKMSRMLLDPTQTPQKTAAEGGALYKFKGGPKVFVSDATIERLAELRLGAGAVGDVPPGQSRAVDDPEAGAPGLITSTVSDLGGRVTSAMKNSDAERQTRAMEAEKARRRGGRAIAIDAGE